MPDYKKMYLALFNAVTTAIDGLQNAQREGEEAYSESDGTRLIILPKTTKEKPEGDG